MTSPEYVNKNFSESAFSYDGAAIFQRRAADLFEKFIKKNLAGTKIPLKILEIGCGTGFMTEKLLKLFPDSDFLVSDISPEMLDVCRNKIEAKIKNREMNISFKAFDASESVPGKDYDLIVSAMTFQWFADIKKSAVMLRKKLAPGGQLFFSTLENSTFSRLRGVFEKLNEPYPGPRFLSLAELEKTLEPFDDINMEKHCYSVKYASVMEFFASLSQTGAVNATGKKMTVPALRRVIRTYSGAYPYAQEDYHIVLAACRCK